jgi:hypothetical protein
MDDRTLARWRLHSLRLAGRSYPSAEAGVDGRLAVQAENYAQASWAVAARTAGVTEEAFGRLYDEGAILRTHVLRPTWHFVRPEDIRWLVSLTAPRIRRTMVQLQRDLDLDDRALGASAEVIAEALSGGVPLSREVLGERLRAARLPSEGAALGTVLFHAELSALICSGPRQHGAHTYALLDERAPNARRLDRDEALAELVWRYFTGHSPATERDLAYWATLTLTDVRAGLAAAAGRLDRLEHDGRTYWFAEPPPPDGPLEPRGHLLQTLDEYHNGYQDSRYVLDADGIVPRGRAAAVGMALIDGQMVGDMRRSVRPRGVRFEVGLFRPLVAEDAAALEAAAHRYGTFLGLEATLVTTDRSGW